MTHGFKSKVFDIRLAAQLLNSLNLSLVGCVQLVVAKMIILSETMACLAQKDLQKKNDK